MRALIDCDVLIDVALERDEWLAESVAVLAWAEQNPGGGWIAWHSLANVHHIGCRLRSDETVRDFLREILAFLEVPPADEADARRALDLRMADFEDALQSVCALAARADAIVTRTTADYRRSPVPAVTPAEFLRRVRP